MEVNVPLDIKSIREDFHLMCNLIDKHVTVQMIKEISFTGFLQSIDPVTNSVILAVPKENSFETTVILGHAITNITEIPPLNDRRPVKILSKTFSPDDLLLRKSKAVAWLKRNLLPVVETDDKIDVGNVSILPPYGSANICTDNAVIAMQIGKILENMPEDLSV